jgi:hypothetical protein
LCNKSAPKGYPKDKSEYGDPACYRYPLDTKARCLAAWRYVHQKDNWSILGDKAKSVESKIKSYANKHYNLDLQTGESEVVDWQQIFVDYYDGETMGERCELIVLEPEESEKTNEVKNMDDKEKLAALEQEVATLKTDKANLETKVTQIAAITKELNDQKAELEALRKFKSDTEEAAKRADRIKVIKSKLDEAGLDSTVEAETDYWLGMSDEVLAKTITKMGDIKKGAQASAEKKDIKVPPVSSDKTDARSIVSEGLNERKQARSKK